MESLIPLLINLLSGAVGGVAAGKVAPAIDQGTVVNSLAGIVGGGLGGQILSMVMPALLSGGGMSIEGILSSVLSGGVGGGALLAIFGVVKNMLAPK